MTRPAAAGRPGSVSVVVASCRDWRLVEACLDSLRRPCSDIGAELILVRADQPGERDTLASRFPAVRLVPAPPEATVPRLRGLGLAAAGGELVALTEDHCLADPAWLSGLADAAADDRTVVGGAMANAGTASLVGTGAFFSEYGFFAGPGGGDPPLLTGANVAYPRPAVGQVARWAQAGEWENVIHARLAAAGFRFRFVPGARVLHNGEYSLAGFCRDRFEHGYQFARRRLAEEGVSRRLLRLLATPLLPVVLTARVARAAAPGNPAAFLRALPLTILFLGAWAVGEAAGYWAGPGGSAA